MTRSPTDGGFGLYIHWPFCEAKCPYCDFNSHVAGHVDHDQWREALLCDLRTQAQSVPNRVLSSIFFGGGTPSRMHPDTVSALIEEARRLWTTVNDLEVTLEANPTSVEAEKFAAFARGGVNRVSVGLQALRDPALRALGRTHDVAQALRALEVARTEFDRVSFDVIYARQDQSMAEWRDELREILALRPDHLSLYQLTIEPGTVFHRRHQAGKLPGLPGDDQIADMYLETNDILSDAGRPAYEVSNHAATDQACRHNLIYWRAGDWLGVGPGAHGRYGQRMSRVGTISVRGPDAWLDMVATQGTGIETRTTAAPLDHAEDYLVTSLRLAEGLDLRRLSALGLELPPEASAELENEGLIQRTETHLRPSLRGRALADHVVSYLAVRAIDASENA